MAKIYLTVAVIFLFCFAFSTARTPADLPLTDVVGDESLNAHPESDIQASTILLPSEKPESESVNLVELEPESTESNFAEFSIAESSPQDSESTPYSVPLTVISFRPINRHFPRRPFPLSFRHGHRCRHGHHQFKPWGPRPLRREVSYGNDMIDGEEPKSKPVFGDEEEPQIRTRMIRLGQAGPRFPFRHDEDLTERPKRHGHDHDHDHEHDHDHHHRIHAFYRHHMGMEGGQTKEGEVEKAHKHNHAETFMKSFRKFLNRF